MEVECESKKGDFLTDPQKMVKQLIMERLSEVIPIILSQNIEVTFDNQAMTDLVMSCLIMFCRDQLTHFFLNSNALGFRDKVMDNIFDQIKENVNKSIDKVLEDGKLHLN